MNGEKLRWGIRLLYLLPVLLCILITIDLAVEYTKFDKPLIGTTGFLHRMFHKPITDEGPSPQASVTRDDQQELDRGKKILKEYENKEGIE